MNCRSRGDLGSCKDPFTMNSTEIETEKGVDAVPCASGWCGKIIERHGLNNGKNAGGGFYRNLCKINLHLKHILFRRIWHRDAKALLSTGARRRRGEMRLYRLELQESVHVPLFRGPVQRNNGTKHLHWLDFRHVLCPTSMVRLRLLRLH